MWASEASGYMHLYLYDLDGGLVRQVPHSAYYRNFKKYYKIIL